MSKEREIQDESWWTSKVCPLRVGDTYSYCLGTSCAFFRITKITDEKVRGICTKS